MKTKYIKRGSFTLIEMMTTLMLVLVLAGITFALVPFASRTAGDYKTNSLLISTDIAMENYNALFGFYPASLSGTTIQYNKFYLDRVDNSTYFKSNTMMQFFTNEQLNGQVMVDGSQSYLIDAYNNTILYRCPGKINVDRFDLISLGSDGMAGDGKAVLSYPSDAENNSIWPYLGTGDDMSNFTK